MLLNVHLLLFQQLSKEILHILTFIHRLLIDFFNVFFLAALGSLIKILKIIIFK